MSQISSSDIAESARSATITYLAVGFLAGAIIALQIAIMRVFAVGSWAHFGSFVISLAMLGFGLASVLIFVAKAWFERHWRGAATAAFCLFGPLAVACNLGAQALPFNAIFITSDPVQKWRLLANFLLYLLPFLTGATFLGIIFLRSGMRFNRAYFADLSGSGVAGLLMLGALYLVPPEDIIAVPLALWGGGILVWSLNRSDPARVLSVAGLVAVSLSAYLGLPRLLDVPALHVTDYKGVSYARNFPDAKRLYRNVSPFGDLQVYKSSYMHFAPGLSDNAAFNVPEVPANTYVGLYVDGDGPEGIMRELPRDDEKYYYYLPDYYPYVLKQKPNTFIVELGGGISTMVALHAGSRSVTAAEKNPAILEALKDRRLRQATGDLLQNPRLTIVNGDGRLYLAHAGRRYDVIDLSLQDSVGLSNPGGFAIVERYAYTRQATREYMNALSDGGIFSVTVWNKEEPPKAVLKLYATMVQAADELGPATAGRSFFVASNYLSTTTVLYKKGGFTANDVATLRDYTQAMSYDEVYSPGFEFDASTADKLLADYQASVFGNGESSATSDGAPSDGASSEDAPPTDDNAAASDDTVMPATTIERLVWHALVHGGWQDVAQKYVFDIRPLTNDRPYFAGYEKIKDLPKTLGRLDAFQDDWGYLVLWVSLGVAAFASLPLILVPLVVGWRNRLARSPGKTGSIVYFACLGLGYIMVEVGLISRFTLALGNATISASILIAGMLVFSGIGSLVSERLVSRARIALPMILAAIGILLAVYSVALAPVLDAIGALGYPIRLLLCFVLVGPPAFLMGFPMATAMNRLAELGKEHMFVWAWGINGCFSVVGATAVPIIATNVGLGGVLLTSAAAYLVSIPAFFAVLRPKMAHASAGSR